MHRSCPEKTIIGITGGLASGKSTVADMLRARGASVIDADTIGHDIMRDDQGVRTSLERTFGGGIIEGKEINRAALRKIVLSDEVKLMELNEIMHPAIIERIRKEIGLFESGVLLVDAPLLIETGLYKDVDIVVVVTSSHETQVKRACERGLNELEAERLIAAQMPLEEKLRFADHIIDNDSDIDKTKEGVEELWHKVKNL